MLFHRRFIACLFVVLASGIFNPQCYGQYDTSLLPQKVQQHIMLQSKCPHGIQRDQCYQCNVRFDPFDKGKSVGRTIKSLRPMPKGRAGVLAVLATGLAALTVFTTDTAVGLGVVGIVVILFVLGIISGYCEDDCDCYENDLKIQN